MSYLICEKCGGYYTLKKGEKPEDFEMCQCGGPLRYIQNFNSHIDEELDPINEINICPDCGTERLASEKYCKSCDKMTKDAKNRKTGSAKTENKDMLNNFEMPNGLLLRALAIIIGILIVVIPTFVFSDQNYTLLLLLIGGLVVSLIAGGKSEDGALNGAVMGLIAALIVLISRGNIPFDDIFFVQTVIFEMGGAILILALFGFVGGLIGFLIRDLLIKTENSKSKKK